LHNFVPVFISRGVVQLSAYLDSVLASLLPSGSVALLGYAQNIGLLPISLFGMSISAAELPAMSRALAGNEEQVRSELTTRLLSSYGRCWQDPASDCWRQLLVACAHPLFTHFATPEHPFASPSFA
jgi:hypothetical protein